VKLQSARHIAEPVGWHPIDADVPLPVLSAAVRAAVKQTLEEVPGAATTGA
jgi:hypothetical protein